MSFPTISKKQEINLFFFKTKQLKVNLLKYLESVVLQFDLIILNNGALFLFFTGIIIKLFLLG